MSSDTWASVIAAVVIFGAYYSVEWYSRYRETYNHYYELFTKDHGSR
jgi:hypothetical protein